MTAPGWLRQKHDPRRWAWNNKPGYLEAYPRISVGEALWVARAGRTHLLWRERRDLVVGAASVDVISRDAIVLHYAVGEMSYDDESAGDLALRLIWKGSRPDNARPFAHCPKCPRHVDVLVLRDRYWACTRCHQLKHRSALLSEEVRWSERLADLEAEIAIGKLASLGTTALRAKIKQRHDLARRVNGKPVTANALYLTRISTEWIKTPALVMSAAP